MDARVLILNTVFFVFAMARSATNQCFIVYFYDYFNIFECDIIFGCRLGLRFVASIIWGYLGDFFSNKKLHFFITTHIISALLSSLFLFQSIMNKLSVTLILISLESFCSGANSLLDAVTVLIVPKNTYGKSRFWWAFGVGCGAVIMGIIAYYFSSNTVYIHFYNITICITCIILILAIYFSPKFSDPLHQIESLADGEGEGENDAGHVDNDNDYRSASELFSEYLQILFDNPVVIMFNSDLFIFGIAHAIVGQSLFIYLLNEFNATEYLCGTVIMSMIIGELIIFYFSKYLLIKIGIIGLLLLSHLSYIFRVICYTFIPHYQLYTYLFLLIEPLHGFTFAGMWIASIEYASRISPYYLKATMIGTTSGIYNGLGNMFGSFIAGYLYHNFGPDFMFRLSGILILIWSIIIQILIRFFHHYYPTKYTKAIY